MKKNIVIIIIVLAVASLSFSIIKKGSKPLSKNNFKNVVQNTVIIKYKTDAVNKLAKDQVAKSSYEAILSKYNAYKVEQVFPVHKNFAKESSSVTIDLSKFYFVNYTADVDPNIVAKELESSSIVEYAEPKLIRHLCFVPNDAYYSQQWGLKKIAAEQAWDVSQGDTNVVIGIIDTGIDWHHPDLAKNIWINKKEIPNNGIDDDGNGYIDDVRGWDFGGQGNGNLPTPDNDPNEDAADHGTHVAGIASAVTNNGLGVASLGFKCKLMAVKVTQNNQRSNGEPDVLFGYEGIVYAADNGANIINCSWGGGGFSRYENEIVQYATQKGALIVAAAGNDASNENGFYPAAYNHVLAVAATNQYDQKAGFSNYGSYVDVSAPGVSILSTWFQAVHSGSDGIYMSEDGTSMASPLVAGLAAMVKSQFPNLTPDQIGERIRVSCDNIDANNPSYINQLGFGRINAYKALTINSPAVRMTNIYINDTLYGNGNGIIEPGERIQLRMEFINYLSSTTNLSVSLQSSDPYVKVNSGSFVPGKISTLQGFNNSSKMFEIIADKSTPYNYQSTLTLNFSDQNYTDFQQFTITLNPSYQDAQINNISTTITSSGNIAYNDYPDNTQGSGFLYKNSLDNILYEGALMFGTSASQLSDCARGSDQSTKDDHFKILKAISFIKGINSDQEGVTSFNDDQNPSKLNVSVNLNTYAYQSSPYNNFIILNYQFKNNNTAAINNFYAGLFFDWDIGPSGDNNIASYDATNKIGYAYNTTGSPNTYTGVSLLNNTDKLNYFPILNDDTSSAYFQVYDGFSNTEKFRSLSSKIGRTSAGPGDISMVLGGGPFSIPANGDINLSFVILAGESLTDIQNSLQYAKGKYNGIKLAVNSSTTIPNDYILYQNYPNPFNPSTKINYQLPASGFVTVKVYDLMGKVVTTLVSGNQSAGSYSVVWDASGIPSGVYFYKLSLLNSKGEASFVQSRKMVLLK